MRLHLGTLVEDLRRLGGERAVVRHVGNRRRVTSYGEIARLAGRFAGLLVARGIGPGERVVLWGENSAEWIAAFYGCMLRGVLAVPLDAHGTAEFAGRVARDVRPSLVVGDAALLATLEGEWPRLGWDFGLCGDGWGGALPEGEAGAVAGLSRDTPLQILFTSGTTGEPKGVVHTHGNVLASVEPIAEAARGYMKYERLVHPLRILHTLPLSHVFGQTMGMWVPPIFGLEVHFEDRLTASRLIETIRGERISVLAAVPRVLAMMKSHLEVEYSGLVGRLAGAQGLRAAKRWWRFRDIHGAFGIKFWCFVTGGGALPGVIEQFWNGLGFVLVQGYGMTETAALITLNHPFRVARGTMGKPLPGREVKLGADGEVLVKGPMVSRATWSGEALQLREGEWLATGDLAEAQATGELRFVGRKSETIVTGAGVNVHPEDLEAVLEMEPEVAACAVVGVETAMGPEACAVLAMRGDAGRAAEIVQRANARLAEFQRIRRWEVWPEPDLPRTSTGKVKRAAVAAWVAGRQRKGGGGGEGESGDWLLEVIAGVTGERVVGRGEEGDLADLRLAGFRLSEDLHLDSLGRVQLMDALEARLGVALNQEEFDGVETLGELRRLVVRGGEGDVEGLVEVQSLEGPEVAARAEEVGTLGEARGRALVVAGGYVYPRWPWWRVFRWIRAGFVEVVMRPLVWLLAAPRVVETAGALSREGGEPMLIIANHVTAYDVPLLLYGLPRAMRDRSAAAMSGEMLDDFRHGRNLQPRWLNPLGLPAWLLITALFNVFPLPRQRDFQRSFAHAGAALDEGFDVMVFPEGTRSADGTLAKFRPGIGLLVKQSFAAVLPMAVVGLGDLKKRRRGWFRSGTVEVRVGKPVRFAAYESEAAITTRLQAEVEKLLEGE